MAIAARMGVDAFVPARSPAQAVQAGKAEKSPQDKGSIAKDVSKIQVWPGSESPMVTQATDPRLANAGMTARVLNFLDHHINLPIAKMGQWVTRTVGPGMYWFSALSNSYYLAKNWNDPKFTTPMKATLVTGAAATVAAAGASTWAALPIKGALTANRFSGMLGGLAGGIFSAANMVITLRNKQSTRVQKTMATAGFVTGIAGTTFGVMAAFLPAGAALGPLGLGAWGMIFGLVSTATALSQMFLGQNKWLNAQFGKVNRGVRSAWNGIKSVF